VEQLAKFWRQTSSAITTAPFNGQEMVLELFDETSAAITATFGAPGFFRLACRRRSRLFLFAKRLSFYDTAPLRESCCRLSISTSSIPARRATASARSRETGNFRYSTRHATDRPEHVMASGALPPGLPMVEIEANIIGTGRRLEHAATVCARL